MNTLNDVCGQGACEATGTLICNDAGTGTECNAQAGQSGTGAVTMWMKIDGAG